MKSIFLRFLCLLLGCFPLLALAQHTNYPAAVDLLEGNVLDSATKKPVSKVWVKISWGDSSRIVPVDADGRMDEGDLFYHTSPDSIRITCAATNYRVTKFKVKTYESTNVLDEKGRKTADKWYLVMITVYVTKVED